MHDKHIKKIISFYLPAIFLVLFVPACQDKEHFQPVSLQGEQKTVETPAKQILSFGVSEGLNTQQIFLNYSPLIDYLAEETEMPVKLVQRRTYQELNDMFKTGDLALGRIATGAFLSLRMETHLELLALAVEHGAHRCFAVVIVPAESPVKTFSDLRGKSFAFTDPLSKAGYFFPATLVRQRGATIETFFAETVFVGSDDNTMKVVANKYVDGGSVSSLRMEENSSIRNKIRIIAQSSAYPVGPIVATENLPDDIKDKMKKIFLNMHQSTVGIEALKAVHLDGFIAATEADFEGIQQLFPPEKPEKKQGE